MFRPLLEVEISKRCTLLWREAHVKVKSVKETDDLVPPLDVEMSALHSTLHHTTTTTPLATTTATTTAAATDTTTAGTKTATTLQVQLPLRLQLQLRLQTPLHLASTTLHYTRIYTAPELQLQLRCYYYNYSYISSTTTLHHTGDR